MNFLSIAGQILLAIAFLGSILGSLGLFNALLYIWQDESDLKFGPMSHAGVWLTSVALMAGIIHTSTLNGWLGMGQVGA